MTPAFDRDLLVLYVLGALDATEAAPIDAAVAAGDAGTIAALAEARRLAGVVGYAAEDVAAPAGAKERLLERVRREGRGGAPAARTAPAGRRVSFAVPFAIAAALLVALGLGLWQGWFAPKPTPLSGDAVELARLAQDPKAVRWTLGPAEGTGPGPGVVWFDPKDRSIRVFADGLGPAPTGKHHVFWYLPSSGAAPVNMGEVVDGRLVLANGVLPGDLNAVAVSEETDPKTAAPTKVLALAKGP